MKTKAIFAILILSLTACTAPQTAAPTSTPKATATATVVPSTPTATATEIPFAALTLEEQVAQYLAGRIQDASALNFEQRKTFSIAYNELKNEQRESKSVTHTDRNNNTTYLGSDGKFHPEKQTIDKYIPRVTDSEGYIHLFLNGVWIKIEDSQNIQYDNFENDFNWPDTEITDPAYLNEENKGLTGLTIPEVALKLKQDNPSSMIPIIISSKEIGEINIPGFGDAGTLFGYPVYENDGYSTTRVILTGNPALFGDGLLARSSGDINEVTRFWQDLEENTLYYMIFSTDQKAFFASSYPNSNGAEVTANYGGLAPSNLAADVLTTGGEKSGEIALIIARILVKKAGE